MVFLRVLCALCGDIYFIIKQAKTVRLSAAPYGEVGSLITIYEKITQ